MRTLVVVGNGMVGQRLVDCLVDDGAVGDSWRVVVIGEERHPAYDRVNLSRYLGGCAAEDLSLVRPEVSGHPHVTLRLAERVVAVDRARASVSTCRGDSIPYDALVLATGSRSFVPPIDGSGARGCFVYRTLDDIDAIRAWATDVGTGVVIGGGLLGLEAAKALLDLGLETHVVEAAPRLMPAQVDEGGAIALRGRIEELGITVHTGVVTEAVERNRDGTVTGLGFADGARLACELVVFAAGIRPRDELARACGLEVAERGGIVVDDRCMTSDPRIHAIGECASHRGRVYGLVSPGYEMARVVAARLTGADDRFTGAAPSTKLKLLGVDVASFGDVHGEREGACSVTAEDPVDRTYARLIVDRAERRLLGGVLVGDTSAYARLHRYFVSREALPERPLDLLLSGAEMPRGSSADETICTCVNVARSEVLRAVAAGATDVATVGRRTGAGTGCGSCTALLRTIVAEELERAGGAVDRSLCEHFRYTRQELFDIVRVKRLRTFDALLSGWGQGMGCEICKPAVASMLASLWNEHILEPEHAGLQDTNDHFLANLQRDGTYSVVPRVPGGEITAEQLVVIGEVAKEHGLYTKITGGQRIDLFGARAEQLPEIWRRLIAAGFESGHAYGKALRTVKSCVGIAWCRYGVQDSTRLAVDLELRYRGLRAPHKIKAAVSGCARECAEAQGKDFGVVATERGWNLYLCGNGGMRPQHGVLFATDLDTATLVRYLDRFLMFYIRTADRLERTATWLNRLEGGVEYLRRVIVDDALGICDQLEADMQRHVETYRCEWKATLDDPRKVARFRSVVNHGVEPDDDGWIDICGVGDLIAEVGVAARIGDEQVAVFRLRDGSLFAVGNRDPFSGADVIARGIVGDRGGVVTVASPVYKQRFALATGQCLDDPGVSIPVFDVRVRGDRVEARRPSGP